jgi:hypothetical protein
MKYNVPYGLPDETTLYGTPYVNGDPSIGRQGSIPPAFSIEHDQREIVAVIQWAYDHGYKDYANTLCQAPNSTDLTQLLKAIFGIFNSNLLLSASTYYVNGTTGSDSNDGLTSSTAFKTLQKAAVASTRYNLNGFSVTVNVAAGLYGPVNLPPVNGSGTVNFVGDTANPINCIIHANTGPAVAVNGGPYYFSGFRFESDASDLTRAWPGAGVFAPTGYLALLTCNEFGTCADGHMVTWGGAIGFINIIRILGGGYCHIGGSFGGTIGGGGGAIKQYIIPNPVNITYFCTADRTSTVSPRIDSITGKANVTGTRYAAQSNGVVDSSGQGITFLPGTIAGITNTGGQYT